MKPPFDLDMCQDAVVVENADDLTPMPEELHAQRGYINTQRISEERWGLLGFAKIGTCSVKRCTIMWKLRTGRI